MENEYNFDKIKAKDFIGLQGIPVSDLYLDDFRKHLKSQNDFTLMVRLNTDCNLDCKYCKMHDYNKFTQPLEIVTEYLDNFINIMFEKNYDFVSYYFYGGEPTIYKYFIETVNFIHEKHESINLKYRIIVQTNLTQDIEFFKKLNRDINLKFICSYQNAEQQKFKNYQEKYKMRAKHLIDNNLLLGFDLMLEDPNDSYIYTNRKPIANDIIELYWHLKAIFDTYEKPTFGIQLNTINSGKVPKEYKEIYNDSRHITEKIRLYYYDENKEIKNKEILYNDLISDQEKNNFFGYICDVGLRQFLIQFSYEKVKLYFCLTHSFSSNVPIYEDTNIEKFKECVYDKLKPQRCLYAKCTCEVYIKKYKNKKYEQIVK